MRHDRNGISKDLKRPDGREEKSAVYFYSEDGSIMLVSLSTRKRAGKKYRPTDNDTWCKGYSALLCSSWKEAEVASARVLPKVR